MEEIVLKGRLRPGRGSADARRARWNGLATGEIYGHGEENVSFLVDQVELRRLVNAGHHLLNLELAGKSEVGLMKELQFDTYGDRITHVDFARVSLDEIIETNVEVRVIGNAKGVASGGTLDILRHELPLRGKARLLPEHIALEVDALDVYESIRAKDITVPAGIEILLDPEDAIIIVHGKVVEAEAPAEVVEDEAEAGEETPGE